jgi:hypothetical protein
VVLDDETHDILKDTASSLEGVVGLGNEPSANGWSRFRGPWAYIDFSSKVISKERLNEPETKAELIYRSGGSHRTTEMVGSDSDLREQALAEVLGQEWGPNSGLNTVSNAIVKLPNGETVNWDEYVKPVLDAANKAA